MTALPKFTGQFEHSLDEKGRLTIPARLRARLGDHFVLTIAPPEPCLAMYPESAWSDFCAKLEAAPRKDAQYRSFVRHLFAYTEEVTLDGQGRLLIPPSLRDYAHLERDPRSSLQPRAELREHLLHGDGGAYGSLRIVIGGRPSLSGERCPRAVIAQRPLHEGYC